MLQKALQVAAFVAAFHVNSVYRITDNGIILTGFGIGAAYAVALPFMAYTRLKWWLLARRNKLSRTVVEEPGFGVIERSAGGPNNGGTITANRLRSRHGSNRPPLIDQ